MNILKQSISTLATSGNINTSMSFSHNSEKQNPKKTIIKKQSEKSNSSTKSSKKKDKGGKGDLNEISDVEKIESRISTFDGGEDLFIRENVVSSGRGDFNIPKKNVRNDLSILILGKRSEEKRKKQREKELIEENKKREEEMEKDKEKMKVYYEWMKQQQIKKIDEIWKKMKKKAIKIFIIFTVSMIILGGIAILGILAYEGVLK